MIDVAEADSIISQNIKEFPAVRVPLEQSFGLVLQEDLVADRDFPPFDRVTMDGVALHFSALDRGQKTFSVKGVQKAGSPPLALKDNQACIEVMTGAVLPQGCDCVIPVERLEKANGQVRVKEQTSCARMQYVHVQGSDHAAGAVLVPKGDRLLAPQIAVAASIGKTEVRVSKIPRIAVVGTGDELVDLHQKMEPTQIRQSNAYALQAALALRGYTHVTRFHLRDDKKAMIKTFKSILGKFDVLILSGGVSMGAFDYVPQALAAAGVETLFHKVKQRPGKPLWFGKNKEGKPVFGLPGNPVSTQVCLYRYVLPYLDRASDAKPVAKEYVALKEVVEVQTELTCFMPVKISGERGKPLSAAPVVPSGSGDFVALVQSDGFIELPADTFRFAQGTSANFFRW